jgi:transposase
VPIEPLPATGRETGIDVGLQVFLITADGEPTENPRHPRKAERALQKAQQRVSRRTKGSTRRRKAVALCAKQHQHVCRQRSDFHHKTALALVRAYDVIYVEVIQPANLSRRPEPKPDGNGGYEHNGASHKAGLNTSIQDAGWRHFLSILAYTAACAGKRVDAVPPASVHHHAGLQWGAARREPLHAAGGQKPVGAHACLSLLWAGARPRRARGHEHTAGRAGPSGAHVAGCGERRLRSPWL